MLVLSSNFDNTFQKQQSSHEKSCFISTNDEDAHQSMHLGRNVGSVHATNKNIENELSHTWPRRSKDKCSSKV